MNLCSVCGSEYQLTGLHGHPDWIRFPGKEKLYFCSDLCFERYTLDSHPQLAVEIAQKNAPQSPKDAPRDDCPACDGTGSSPCQFCQGTGHRTPNAPQPHMLSKEDIDLIESGLLCILDDNATHPHTDAKAEGEHIKKVLDKLGCPKREYLERLYP